MTMRSRRVASSSRTRWSSTITQSETYSSMPSRVSWPSLPRSPVITVVRPWSLSQRSSRPNSGAHDRPRCRARRTAPRWCRARRAWRRWPCTAAASRMNSPSRSKSPVVIDLGAGRAAWRRRSAGRRPRVPAGRSPGRRRCRPGRPAVSSKASSTPGSSKFCGSPHEELQAEQGLARPGAAGDQRGPAGRQAAAGELVEAADPGGRLRHAGPAFRCWPHLLSRAHRTPHTKINIPPRIRRSNNRSVRPVLSGPMPQARAQEFGDLRPGLVASGDRASRRRRW